MTEVTGQEQLIGSGFFAKGTLFNEAWPEVVVVVSSHAINSNLQMANHKPADCYFKLAKELEDERKFKFVGEPLLCSNNKFGAVIYEVFDPLPNTARIIEAIAPQEFLSSIQSVEDYDESSEAGNHVALTYGMYSDLVERPGFGFGMSRIAGHGFNIPGSPRGFDPNVGQGYRYIFSFYATAQGVSGSPVFDCDSGLLIGIHQAGLPFRNGPPNSLPLITGYSQATWIGDIVRETRSFAVR